METLAFYELFALLLGVSVFLMLAGILIRLRKIINTTFNLSQNAALDHYFEARILEVSGEHKEALKSYYRCYTCFRSIKFSSLYVNGHKLTKDLIENKIEELGGVKTVDIFDVKSLIKG